MPHSLLSTFKITLVPQSVILSDYLREMSLEIAHQFFPPPTVAVPSHSITYPLDALEDEVRAVSFNLIFYFDI